MGTVWYICWECHKGKGTKHPEEWVTRCLTRIDPHDKASTFAAVLPLLIGPDRGRSAVARMERQLELLQYVPVRRLTA